MWENTYTSVDHEGTGGSKYCIPFEAFPLINKWGGTVFSVTNKVKVYAVCKACKRELGDCVDPNGACSVCLFTSKSSKMVHCAGCRDSYNLCGQIADKDNNKTFFKTKLLGPVLNRMYPEVGIIVHGKLCPVLA